MKRSESRLPTAQLLGCAVAFLSTVTALALPSAAADPRDAVAACVRAAPVRANQTTVEGCMRASGFDPSASGAPIAIECIVERYPAGDLAGCLEDLTPASPAASAAAAPAGGAAAQAAAAVTSEPQNVAQAPGQGPTENPPNGSVSTNPPTAEPPATPAPTQAPTAVPIQVPVAAPPGAPPGELPWWPLAVAFAMGALLAAAITYFAARSERERAAEQGGLNLAHESSAPIGVRIATPNDFSVHACDSPITLSANVVPPERASDLVWTIVSPENRTIAQGAGAQFAFTAGVTGVYHIVARLDQTADDLLLFIYKTPSGGTRLTDLLQAEPPPFPREPTSFVWNRSRTL